ncbi:MULTISPECIES: sigma-70 family RNA polymerase sigma factor [unclassified Exiguobacterium]|uniref:RNA polymerase sigma factor n=1 Tax=unclassified Exiguobacterium TaxID=2644629 RepID=UPI001BEB4E02|nr:MULTISPECIES: sigma-70 family RNA polymerase sigma factor [unclassified Exiguobacterium]
MIGRRNKRQPAFDDDTFLMFLTRHDTYLYKMSYLYLKNDQDALENVQEVAYRAWKHRRTLLDATIAKTWLTRIAINCALDMLKKTQGIRVDYATAATDVAEPVVFEERIVNDLYLQELLEVLTVAERTILFLRYYEDYTLQHVADLLQIPVSTVKSTLYRAIQKVQTKQVKGGGAK